MSYSVIPHRILDGGLSLTVGGADLLALAEGLTWTNNNAGGYGSAEWVQRSAPPAVGAVVAIESEGESVFEGKVTSVESGIGERLRYRVSCLGRADELKDNETYSGVFVDRDLAQWQVADCGNWPAAPDFEIAVDATGSLCFSWPDSDKLMCDRSDPEEIGSTAYEHEGNALPRGWHRSDFATPKVLWSAAYYLIGGGIDPKPITGLSLDAYWNLETPLMDAKKTSDYTNPIGPPDEKYGHRFSRYPKINYWTGFYGLAHAPGNAFAAIYCCDVPGDLPVKDPRAMRCDPHLLHLFRPRTALTNRPAPTAGYPDSYRLAVDPVHLRLACSGQLLVVYAAYLPVQLPMNLAHRYSKNADHLVRTEWVAVNRIYAEPGQYLELKNLSVYSQGYEGTTDGGDDLAEVFTILFPDRTVTAERMKLPTVGEDEAPVSIAVRAPTTRIAAIPELLSLYPSEMCWGIWEDGELVIASDLGAAAISDEPGVDTTGAAQTDEGAVDLVLVAYLPAAEGQVAGSLAVESAALLLVDYEGTVTEVTPEWTPDPGVRVAFLDAVGQAVSATAAARMGQIAAIARRRDQWSGSVALWGITGASAIRPGVLLSGAGITDALVTSARVDVDADTVTLALGATGYFGRFSGRVPGKPMAILPGGQLKTETTVGLAGPGW